MGAYSGFDKNNEVLLMNEMSEEAILEAYFGVSKELEDIITQLGVFRSKYTDRYKYGMYFDDVNIDPDLLKFNRMIEDFFGFGTFSLIVDPRAVINAFTFPIGTRIDTNTRADIRADKNGYKYDKSAGYVCVTYIYTGLIFDDEFTDREIMSIILHEIGHNFSGTMNNLITFTEFISKILFLPRVIMGIIYSITNPVTGGRITATTFNSTSEWYVNFMKKAREDNGLFSLLVRISKGFSGIVSDINSNISAIRTPFILMIPGVAIQIVLKNIMKNPLELINLFSGYQNERIADNFPTMYGLGPETASVEKKMAEMDGGVDIKRAIMNTPILGHLYDLITLPILAVLQLMDPHPATPQRINNQLLILKKEIEKEKIDPKLKKEIQANIDDIERQMKKTEEEFTLSDGRAFSKIYGFILLKLFKGDFREIFQNTDKDVKMYDKAYEKALAKTEKK